MRKIGLLLIAGVLALTGCGSDPLNAYTEAFGYEKALEVAKKENKKLFIDFSASWCGPCQQLKRTLHNPKVVEALRNYVVLMVDVDKAPQLAQRFDVHGIPNYFVVDGNGRKLSNGEGYRDVDDFQAWLKQSESQQ